MTEKPVRGHSDLVGYAAFKEERDDYGVLPTKPNQLLNRLRRMVGREWSEGGNIARVRKYTGVLDRLRSFLLQARRMGDHESNLITFLNVESEKSQGYAFQAAHAGDEACTDFESLLFHGRAALDRLTLLVSGEHGQRLDRFSRFEAFLRESVGQTARVKATLDLIAQCRAIKGSVVDLETLSLRSRVIHRSSLSEGIVSHFNIVSRPRGRVLVLDCEAFGYGVLSLSRELAVEIPFLVLNTLKLYLDAGKPLAMGGFRQKHFPVACLSDFATDDKNQPLIHVAKIEPDGFTMTGRHVRREIFKLARRI